MSRTLLTVAEVCEELGVHYKTMQKWRARGVGPKAVRLPNGQLRIDRAELDAWMESLEAA